MDKVGIQQIVVKNPEFRDKLFARGFLFTNTVVEESSYPFYNEWRIDRSNDFTLLVSPKQHHYKANRDDTILYLIGHAYNPFSLTGDESRIISELAGLFTDSSLSDPSSAFWTKINELTGVFTIIIINNGSVCIIGDASGMQTTFYTVVDGNIYISSHTNLIGDILNLKWDPYIQHLSKYRFFKLLGNSLPGDLTQFSNVRRLIPNHYALLDKGRIEKKRFYWPKKVEKSQAKIIDEVADLLHRNMQLISQKWHKPAVSLTGGCDSKTTLACANGLYDHFRYFSYISSDAEKVDAEAAGKICKALNLEHKIYEIPDDDSALPKIKEAAEIINWNTGNIRYSHPEDVRKRVYFAETKDFDVEVKSWASEIGRAYYSKRFNGRTKFGSKPTPRKCTTLYKFFFNDRKLVRQTDKVFEKYLNNYFEQAEQNPIEWQEQFFWEFRVPSWNGLVITGEHRYSFDITIPYNNRKILELLLSVPIEVRITDDVYKAIRNKMNPYIEETGISITNLKHTNIRALIESIYFAIHSNIPF